MPISNKTRLFDFLRTLITVEQWFNFHIFLSRIFAKVCELKAFNLNIFHASNFFIFLLILEHGKFQYYPLIRKMTFCLLNSKKTSLQKFFIFHLLFFLNSFSASGSVYYSVLMGFSMKLFPLLIHIQMVLTLS